MTFAGMAAVLENLKANGLSGNENKIAVYTQNRQVQRKQVCFGLKDSCNYILRLNRTCQWGNQNKIKFW